MDGRAAGRAATSRGTRLERLLLEADRLREGSRRKLEQEVRRLEEILRMSR
jgi:hypothetical protein